MTNNSAVYSFKAFDYNTLDEKTEFKPALAAEQKSSYGINTAYTFILVSAIIAVTVMSVFMLKAQFAVADTSERIIAFTQELNDLKRVNDKLEASINETVDLKEIRRIAMDDYGMVLRNDTNTLRISKKELSFTEQMAPIAPEKEADITLGNVLGLISKDW